MSYQHLSEKKDIRTSRAMAGEQRGGISMPAIKPLLKKSADRDAPVQRYKHLDDDQNKVADNGEMYVEGVGTGNKLFAKPSLITNATQELTDAGAAVKLVEGTETRTISKPGSRTGETNQLTAVHLKNAKGHPNFKHLSSCVDEARKIMKALNANGFNDDDLYQEVLGYLLEKTGSSDIVRERKEEIAGNARAKTAGVEKLQVDVYNQFRDLYYNAVYKNKITLGRKWEYVRKKMNDKYPRQPHHTVESFWNNLERVSHMKDDKLPDVLTPENLKIFKAALQGQLDTRQLLATHNVTPGQEVEGVNEKAKPKVGGAFLILSGGDNYEKTLTWNYHWGAAVMKGETDIVTMESYAGNETMMGTWDMYSLGKARQSFHREHADTHMHGQSPVTVGTWAENDNQLHVGSESDLTEENALKKGTGGTSSKKTK